MKPGLHDFTVQRGGSGDLTIRLRSADDAGVRTPLDLTGNSFVLSVAWPGGSLRRTSDDGGLSVDARARRSPGGPRPRRRGSSRRGGSPATNGNAATPPDGRASS